MCSSPYFYSLLHHIDVPVLEHHFDMVPSLDLAPDDFVAHDGFHRVDNQSLQRTGPKGRVEPVCLMPLSVM